MAIGDRTYRWAREQAVGTLKYKNCFTHRFGYTETRKKVAAASNTAVLAATATATSAQTITTGITNPDVPRCLKVVTGGTTADIAASTVTITGTNVEGKTISESFTLSDNQNGATNGTKAFKTVSRVVIGAQDGATATISVGYQNVLGLNHRLVPGKSSIVVIQDTSVNANAPTIQAAATASTVDAEEVELNTVTPVTAPDGTTFLTILYWYHNVSVFPTVDEPDYGTSTSTSSTSTSTSTSTSSTSTSTSSTSSSTSSTSTSTSSTSTSTTTLP